MTFAKEFTGDAWTVKPSLDLTLTGNFGDDKTDGTAHWAGVENLSTNVSSEVIDNFTYGATLGVAAKTGNFSLGLGVNYTGSSNVDEFGVQDNARFVFYTRTQRALLGVTT
ncbi:MAG TPA: autotransporter domain-containing protein [Candidatus Anaerobiospirillum pullistercoris]|uniref:Autotransporter domain-containing protein n=1 Tax=Candidatus Anaerobiospirillum pullistercoris TaxID=2838452 RepID=A0A9D2AZX4_9GAMM|nr:autotransporter domain-containing protein [Candidatus Anaerobiospirillum pullistercoris]